MLNINNNNYNNDYTIIIHIINKIINFNGIVLPLNPGVSHINLGVFLYFLYLSRYGDFV